MVCAERAPYATKRATGSAVGDDRFLRDIAVGAKLDHPNIVPLFDSGEAGGHLWYTMPYVVGLVSREGRPVSTPSWSAPGAD